MEDQFIHDNEPEFDAFVEETLKTVSANAEAQGICIECLSDRLVVELVCGMVRSGVSVSAILGMVGEGIETAGVAELEAQKPGARRMH